MIIVLFTALIALIVSTKMIYATVFRNHGIPICC